MFYHIELSNLLTCLPVSLSCPSTSDDPDAPYCDVEPPSVQQEGTLPCGSQQPTAHRKREWKRKVHMVVVMTRQREIWGIDMSKHRYLEIYLVEHAMDWNPSDNSSTSNFNACSRSVGS